jgi:hypothetical protein
VIDNNLHSILHTHCVTKAMKIMKTTSGCVVQRLCIPFCTHICVTTTKIWKLHLVMLHTDFALHCAHTFVFAKHNQNIKITSWLCSILHTFVFRKHNQNIKKPHLIYAVDRECSELLYLEDLEVEVTVRPPA